VLFAILWHEQHGQHQHADHGLPEKYITPLQGSADSGTQLPSARGVLDRRTNTDSKNIENAKVTSMVATAAQAGIFCTRRMARVPNAICHAQLIPCPALGDQ
jgi:hypothetical protein